MQPAAPLRRAGASVSLGATAQSRTVMPTPTTAADRPRFITVLIRVLAVQVVAGLLLWFLQQHYTR